MKNVFKLPDRIVSIMVKSDEKKEHLNHGANPGTINRYGVNARNVLGDKTARRKNTKGEFS